MVPISRGMGKKMSALDKMLAYQNGMNVDDIDSLSKRQRKHRQDDFGNADSFI
jgi:hypothetical protein